MKAVLVLAEIGVAGNRALLSSAATEVVTTATKRMWIASGLGSIARSRRSGFTLLRMQSLAG